MTSRLERERVCAPKFGSLPAYIYIFLCVHTYISLKVYCLFVGAFANIHSIPAVPFFFFLSSNSSLGLFFSLNKDSQGESPENPCLIILSVFISVVVGIDFLSVTSVRSWLRRRLLLFSLLVDLV